MECVFCKIVVGEVPAFKIYEDEKWVAFLDIFPVREGQIVVASKAHLPSDVLGMEIADRQGLFECAVQVSQRMKTALGCDRCVLVAEGLGVDHGHVKLYPVRAETEGGLIPSGERAKDDLLKLVAQKFTL